MIKERTYKLKEKGLSVDYIIRIGVPEDEILAVARSQYPDIIVMGSSGTLRSCMKKKALEAFPDGYLRWSIVLLC